MPAIHYTSIPSKTHFQQDTSIRFAFRSDDKILVHLDFLLENYYAKDHTRRAILLDLFFTCEFWLKLYEEGHKKMRKERLAGIQALADAVVRALCALFECGYGELANVISEIYGRDMAKHGFTVDYDHKSAKYFSERERELYRLRFKAGRAYQYKWWQENPGHNLAVAESSRAFNPKISRRNNDNGTAKALTGFGTFIMTIDRALYMAMPSLGNGPHTGTFHSSFTGGAAVAMAGTILIRNGIVEAIRPDSGHYQPTEMNMALLLQALAMYGVRLDRVKLFNFEGELLGDGLSFLRAHMSWKEFAKQREIERLHRKHADQERSKYGLNPKYPHLAGVKEPEPDEIFEVLMGADGTPCGTPSSTPSGTPRESFSSN